MIFSKSIEEIDQVYLRVFLLLAISKLTRERQLILGFSLYEELTPIEIAEVMGIPETKVVALYDSAIGEVRGRVIQHFGLAEGEHCGLEVE